MTDRLHTNEAIEGLRVIANTSRNGKDFLYKSALKIKELNDEVKRLQQENERLKSGFEYQITKEIEQDKEIVQLQKAIEKASDELGWGDVENANLRADRILVKALKGGSQ